MALCHPRGGPYVPGELAAAAVDELAGAVVIVLAAGHHQDGRDRDAVGLKAVG